MLKIYLFLFVAYVLGIVSVAVSGFSGISWLILGIILPEIVDYLENKHKTVNWFAIFYIPGAILAMYVSGLPGEAWFLGGIVFMAVVRFSARPPLEAPKVPLESTKS